MKWYSYSKGAPKPLRSMSAGHAQWIVAVDRCSGLSAVVYLRWFIQGDLPKELLNKRRQNRDK